MRLRLLIVAIAVLVVVLVGGAVVVARFAGGDGGIGASSPRDLAGRFAVVLRTHDRHGAAALSCAAFVRRAEHVAADTSRHYRLGDVSGPFYQQSYPDGVAFVDYDDGARSFMVEAEQFHGQWFACGEAHLAG